MGLRSGIAWFRSDPSAIDPRNNHRRTINEMFDEMINDRAGALTDRPTRPKGDRQYIANIQ
ncbi:MAG: hypothetical protein EA001_05030 [Oscillatoriales cyanobacterium]|nr:MAG: hypothetical protein EA001_05030 [Oscillatoriales cyanobacterium]